MTFRYERWIVEWITIFISFCIKVNNSSKEVSTVNPTACPVLLWKPFSWEYLPVSSLLESLQQNTSKHLIEIFTGEENDTWKIYTDGWCCSNHGNVYLKDKAVTGLRLTNSTKRTKTNSVLIGLSKLSNFPAVSDSFCPGPICSLRRCNFPKTTTNSFILKHRLMVHLLRTLCFRHTLINTVLGAGETVQGLDSTSTTVHTSIALKHLTFLITDRNKL